jgi:acyl-CoA synthetase (AMP-forming)/AMP-acid ligase II
LLNPCWKPFEFEYALRLTKATRLFVQDQLIPTVDPAAKNVGIKDIYVLGQKFEGLRTFEEMLEDARSRVIAPVSPRAVTKDTLAYLMFSSGTTGLPKGR